MDEVPASELSCTAKIVRVVLENCGPLAPSEIAGEAYISESRAASGIEELEAAGFVEPVCGVCEAKEEVFALTESPEPNA